MFFQATECASFRESALANYTLFSLPGEEKKKNPIKKVFMFKVGILKKKKKWFFKK